MSRWLSGAAIALALSVGACRFAADYDGTHFACGAVAPQCPGSQVCVAGVCTSPQADADPAADASELTAIDAAFDAPLGTFDAPDDDTDAPGHKLDAASPDAMPPDAMIPTGLVATADTTLDSLQQTYNYGATTTLAIRNGAPRATAVLRFDLSSIAPGTVVTHATLRIQVAPGGDDDEVVEVHRILEAWQEGTQTGAAGTASWLDRKDATSWTGAGAQGGSRGADAMGTITANGSGHYAIALDVPTVQSWITSPENNLGMVLYGVSGTSLELVSREGDLAARPRLDVAFSP